MKKLFTALISSAVIFSADAKDGYRIRVKLLENKDTLVYLAHYYGKSFPTIFKMDSARVSKNGTALFESNKKTVGGIYLILPSDRSGYFEFLLDNGDDITLTANMRDLANTLKFEGSANNDDFLAYQKFLTGYSKKLQALKEELALAKTSKDSNAVKEKMSHAGDELIAYRKKYVTQHGNSLLASIFNALEVPKIPEGKHLMADGKEDSSFAYRYYKEHYWDGFNFKDDRLIHAPILEAKLDEYFNKIVAPMPDSVNKEADIILEKARGSENLFKFTLNWLSTNAQTSKVMGMDEVFVYLVEHYYMRGDANWLSEEELQRYYKRAGEISPNLVGNPAPEIKMWDINGKPHSLHDFKAKYTLLVFWSPDCGHCIRQIPLLDSAYRAVLKDKGVRIYAAMAEGEAEKQKWIDFIAKHHLEDWLHVWDPEYKSRYWALYDVKSTPSIYLLDEDKIIQGKKLDHTTIEKAIEIAERKKKAKNK